MLVWFGRHVCDARAPRCGECEMIEVCPRHGVGEKPGADSRKTAGKAVTKAAGKAAGKRPGKAGSARAASAGSAAASPAKPPVKPRSGGAS